MTSQLCLRPLVDLLDERFVIPSYQRGYRWTRRQVRELLDDVLEFERAKPVGEPADDFYCLQPIVVKPREDGAWEVIDGQQRLTTLLLVLGALRPLMDALGLSPYEIRYDTRPGSAVYLQEPSEERAKENVDYFHLFDAHQEITTWCQGLVGARRFDFVQRLVHATNRNVRFIWYELPAEANPIDVFVRLNVGKVRLTNAELIRALFLRERNFGGDSEASAAAKYRIAQEWDALEKRLQNDAFWYFINDGRVSYPARIEYLFAIQVEESTREGDDFDPELRTDEYGTFLAFAKEFADGADALERWRRIRQLAQRLDEWDEDRLLYHLVGFLITTSTDEPTTVVVELLQERSVLTRREFVASLKARIFEQFASRSRAISAPVLSEIDHGALEAVVRERLLDLDYSGSEDQRRRLRAALLLFNVASLLRNTESNLRFPFDLFKKEHWDIEHIRSVKSDQPQRPEHMKDWLSRIIEYWDEQPPPRAAEELAATNAGSLDEEPLGEPAVAPQTSSAEPSERDALRNEAVALANAFDRHKFPDLYERILAYFGEDATTEAEHGIQNLALLDARTNRSYRNSVFPVKRRRVLRLDKEGTFAPLCTTNVFLKYYSRSVEHMMFWQKCDEHDYLAAQAEMLTHFFGQEVA